MPASRELDLVAWQVKGRNAAVSEEGKREFTEDPFSPARGMVNGLAAGLIFWAVIIYLLMK
jgi:hypothetical protein